MVLNLPGFNQLTGFQYLKIRNEGGLDIPNIIINRPFELEFGEIATPEGIEDDSALKVTNGINYFPEPFNGNTLNSIFWTEAGDVSVTDGIFSIIVDFGTAFSTLSFAL